MCQAGYECIFIKFSWLNFMIRVQGDRWLDCLISLSLCVYSFLFFIYFHPVYIFFSHSLLFLYLFSSFQSTPLFCIPFCDHTSSTTNTNTFFPQFIIRRASSTNTFLATIHQRQMWIYKITPISITILVIAMVPHHYCVSPHHHSRATITHYLNTPSLQEAGRNENKVSRKLEPFFYRSSRTTSPGEPAGEGSGGHTKGFQPSDQREWFSCRVGE